MQRPSVTALWLLQPFSTLRVPLVGQIQVLCPHRTGSSSRRPSQEWAKKYVECLTGDARDALKKELSKYDNNIKTSDVGYNPSASSAELTKEQLHLVFYAHAFPFIGFGFLDNFIMIIAGESIDLTFASFGLSTMAAAGLGNLISDVCGLSFVSRIENLCSKFGVRVPPLTSAQMALPPVRRAINMGRYIGITLGCLLGMSPLLWFNFLHTKADTEQADNEAVEK